MCAPPCRKPWPRSRKTFPNTVRSSPPRSNWPAIPSWWAAPFPASRRNWSAPPGPWTARWNSCAASSATWTTPICATVRRTSGPWACACANAWPAAAPCPPRPAPASWPPRIFRPPTSWTWISRTCGPSSRQRAGPRRTRPFCRAACTSRPWWASPACWRPASPVKRSSWTASTAACCWTPMPTTWPPMKSASASIRSGRPAPAASPTGPPRCATACA